MKILLKLVTLLSVIRNANLDNKLDCHDNNALQMYDDLLNLEKVSIDYARGQPESNPIF